MIMNRTFALVASFIVTCVFSHHAWTDDVASTVAADAMQRESVLVGAEGYKGGLPFYTAFHQGLTTRLLLLHASRKSPELAKHLRLSEEQRQHIEKLALPDLHSLRSDHSDAILDDNAAIDEEIVDPDFYNFLDEEQRSRLDGVSLVFDGWSAISRTSLSNRLQLSDETRLAVAAVITKHREDIFLPYARYVFAAKLPKDHDFRDCEFTGRYLSALNRAIAEKLSPDELKRFIDWANRSPPKHEVVESIRGLAPLPAGLFGLNIDNAK